LEVIILAPNKAGAVSLSTSGRTTIMQKTLWAQSIAWNSELELAPPESQLEDEPTKRKGTQLLLTRIDAEITYTVEPYLSKHHFHVSVCSDSITRVLINDSN